MPELFSVLFAAFILVACFKLFFDDFGDLWTSVKDFCWWFTFSMILDWSPERNGMGLRFLLWLAIGVTGGFLLYYRLSSRL